MKEGEIKGKKQQGELTKAIDFISNNFDEFENKEKEERINLFFPNVLFLYPLKTSENLTVF